MDYKQHSRGTLHKWDHNNFNFVLACVIFSNWVQEMTHACDQIHIYKWVKKKWSSFSYPSILQEFREVPMKIKQNAGTTI